MHKEFVTYEQAIQLKELGFDPFMRENCLAYFNTSNSNNDLETKDWWCLPKNDFQYALSAPLKQQVFRWFREKYNFIGVVGLFSISDQGISSFEFYVDKIHYIGPSNFQEFVGFKTYEEAESACIDRLIEIVKNK